ncbi:hypothetical protein P154DRAFT_604518 [Amniculicola lignicola CBS 123094]|uniref:Uncharacterized protein n=1 Tax=Amniculicola lignicola CBS 123094 TaxID=1392246 RepID=A0A6A5WBN4_9PLEO|nr:hypothetical protein P154DRAFT_604518 [Amniculicola lignicola CBS 123094]
MAPLRSRASPAGLSTTAFAAILTGVGVVLLGLFIGLVVLLVRAIRTHKRLLADLEERGVVIAQIHAQESKRDSITRPQRVLQRNSVLPFNNKSGWGALSSGDTIRISEPRTLPPHYAPPKPAGCVNKSSRLSWPFSARRASGRAIHLRKIRVPILSTVIESPKPSPLVPVLSGSLGGNASRKEPLRRSLTAKPVTKTETRVRPNRSKSVAEIPIKIAPEKMSRIPRPSLHGRSASLCSQSSGKAPDNPIPPLPLEVARLKAETRRRSLLSRSPSRFSVSSHESANSSILATQSSPILPRSTNVRVQKVTKRDWRNSMIAGPRPLRDTLMLHGKNQQSLSSIKSSTARLSMGTPLKEPQSQAENRSSTLTNSSSLQSIGKLKTAESMTMSKVSSPSCSPLTVRSLTTPRRKSGSYTTAYGSPQERPKFSSVPPKGSKSSGGPKRQLSQASTQASSTRSSNGNPFQWDPAPLASGKPSALKGSPSARKGHRRKNCVRISLDPTILGPPSRSPSPSAMKDIQEEPPNVNAEKRNSVGLGFSTTRSLPRPPSASVFAPDVKLTATSIRASLTPSSPTLSLANYENRPGASSQGSKCSQQYAPGQDGNRISLGPVFSIPNFPSPCDGFRNGNSLASPPPTFAFTRPSNEYREQLRSDPVLEPSSPFEVLPSELPSIEQPQAVDEYDPERPHLVYQTPRTSPTQQFSSAFSTIPEESSVASHRIQDYQRLQNEDSPPCSPKTVPLSTFSSLKCQQSSNDNEKLDTIDPVLLSKDTFSLLNSSFEYSNPRTSQTTQTTISMPTSPGFTKSMFEPLLEAAFPSSPPTQDSIRATTPNQRGLAPPSVSAQSSPSSIYSVSPNSSRLPSPIAPCSPRPRHSQLPTPSLNFNHMPTLAPSPRGPRSSPPRPLSSSIQKLRRMNSDARKGSREERRYLRLGREDSTQLPGEESWLDELDRDDVDEEGEGNGEQEDQERSEMEWDEGDDAKGRLLVGSVLEDWEEEATMLEVLDNYNSSHSSSNSNQSPDNLTDSPTTPAQTVPPPSPSTPMPAEPSSTFPNPRVSTPEFQPPPPSFERSSSIWEDGERFWQSTPPHPPNSPNKPRQNFIPLSSSPVPHNLSPYSHISSPHRCHTQTQTHTLSSPTTKNPRKRDFSIAKDSELASPTQIENRYSQGRDSWGPDGEMGSRDDDNGNANTERRSLAGKRYRKRSALGVTTPNLKITVQPPSSEGRMMGGTPGSLYDVQGFLVQA